MDKVKYKEFVIDAEGKSLGRVASEAARILRGKDLTDFQPNIVLPVKVKVINLSKVEIIGKKLEQKTYKRYSGYPGSLKYIPLKKFWEKDPKAAFKKILQGMLPKNKLRKEILKNLTIE